LVSVAIALPAASKAVGFTSLSPAASHGAMASPAPMSPATEATLKLSFMVRIPKGEPRRKVNAGIFGVDEWVDVYHRREARSAPIRPPDVRA
jgi:hypothetical protein